MENSTHTHTNNKSSLVLLKTKVTLCQRPLPVIDGVIWKYTKIPVLLSFRKTNILNSSKETIVQIKNTLTRQEHNAVQKSMEKNRDSSSIVLAARLIRNKVLTGPSHAVEKCRSQS